MLERAFEFRDVLVGGHIDVPPSIPVRLMLAEGAVRILVATAGQWLNAAIMHQLFVDSHFWQCCW